MRSLLARLALVGLVGVALSGCGASSGTTLPAGSTANGAGGGSINTSNGIGAPPLGLIASLLIDNGNATSAPYTVVSGVGADSQNIVQALQDPASAAVPSVPPSPGGVTPSQTTDPGSHAATVSGNGFTVLKLKYSGVVPNLTYPFGTGGNSSFFNYSQIIAHFALGTIANGSVLIAGVTTPGDTIVIMLNNGSVGYTVTAADTAATIATALVAAINNCTTPAVCPTGATAAVHAWVDVTNPAIVRIAGVAAGAGTASGTPPTGNTGNTITLGSTVLSGNALPPGDTAVPTGGGAAVCVPAAGGTATSCTGTTLTGGVTTGAPGTFSTWAIELVGNGSAAGPGSAAATYDVRVNCSASAVGISANRFVCGTLPAYGAPSTNAPTSGLQGAAAYSPPIEAVFPSAAGAFTPINPTLYVELVYTAGTNETVTAGPCVTGTTSACPWIDYIYAAQ